MQNVSLSLTSFVSDGLSDKPSTNSYRVRSGMSEVCNLFSCLAYKMMILTSYGCLKQQERNLNQSINNTSQACRTHSKDSGNN
eukprot:6249026-Amphidinium_carterae.1